MLDNLTINDLPEGVVDVVEVIGMDALRVWLSLQEEVIYIYLMNQVLLKGLETG